MAKATQSKISGIVGYFRSVPLEVMDIAFDLVRDAVNERRAKSREAKARATGEAGVSAAAAPAKKAKTKGPKKSHKKKPAVAAGDPALPLTDGVEDAGEAGDAPPLQTLSGSGSTTTGVAP